MDAKLACPHCSKASLDVRQYESMIVITTDYALFGMRCPSCDARISCVRPIPDDLRDEVLYAAIEVGAGMGLSN